MALTNASDVYFGTYARFQTPDKRSGAVLAGPDNAIGDIGTVSFELDENKRNVAWLVNPYGHAFGFLDASMTHKLAVLKAKDWEIRFVLSYTAYSEQPEPGHYWGQVAVIAYDKRYRDSFDTFVKVFARAAGEGNRPDPALGNAGVAQVLADAASWKTPNKVKIPSMGKGTAILKDHRTAHDKLLDKGRQKNIGCYVLSWAFIVGVVALVAWWLHSMGILALPF